MKTQKLKRMMSLFLAALICVTTLVGFGTTAYAAEETDEVCLVSFPRDGDANYGGEWGHGSFNFMNGWFAQTSRYTTVRAMGSYDGNICYCIEPGVPQESGDRYTKKGENFWDNYPSSYNHTISPDDIKLFIGRIFQYGYTGTISTSWRSQNEGGDKLAHAVATQLLVWETIVGERDADFNKVGTGGKDAICDQVSTGHPLYSQIMSYYNSIAASVQTHSKVPSFFAKSTGKAKNIELEWDGEKYTATLTDTNNVLSNYTFSASVSGIRFSVNGKKLVITADTAPSDTVRITAEKKNSQRRGVITWTDGVYGPNGKLQDIVTYAQSVNDPVKGYLNIKVSYGSAKIVKTSEDGKVEGISFTITGNGVNKTVQTGEGGVIQIDNLTPGVYTVIEQAYDKYEPQEVRRVTVVSGQVATVNFSNVLKRGDLTVTKTSEDGLNEGVKFHLFGTSLSGLAVDEYAVTDSTGKAHFRDVLIGTGYTLEEVETAIRYVVPENQTAAIEWNKVTSKSFTNILKKWNVTVTKSDSETGTPQGDASLGGAVYGIYKGEQLIDRYTTDANGQFTTKYYVCGDDWSVREITPSEGYLLDESSHHIAAGGWVAVVIIIVVCLIALIVGSCFGIFFSGEDSGSSMTMQSVVQEINTDYQTQLDTTKTNISYDVLEMSGSRAVWPEVLAVYAVKTTTDPNNPQDVATMDASKKAILKDIFWQMNTISSRTETKTEEIITETDDGHGNIVETKTTVTRTYLYISVAHKTAGEMADKFGFNADQRKQLAELLAEENRSMWSAVLYGIYTEDGQIVSVALSQIGNVGGQPYWSWYGFDSRVEWCACFVSWAANECGYIDSGIIPKFAGCTNGVQWFKDRGQWIDNSATPSPGMIIFFDWNNKGSSGPQDGLSDHVGIVERVEDGIIYTIEGNSGDSCRENHYAVGHYEFLGYGVPAY